MAGDREKPLTRNTSIIELSITVAGLLLVGGIAWGTMAAKLEAVESKSGANHDAVGDIKDDVEKLKTDVEVIKVRVESADERSKRIEAAVNTLLTRIPNGHNGR